MTDTFGGGSTLLAKNGKKLETDKTQKNEFINESIELLEYYD